MAECLHNHLVRDENMQPGTYSCVECEALFSVGPFVNRTEIVKGTKQ